MGVDQRVQLILAVPIQQEDLYDKGASKWICCINRHPGDPGHTYCPKCGACLMEEITWLPKSAYLAYAKEMEFRDYDLWTPHVATLDTPPETPHPLSIEPVTESHRISDVNGFGLVLLGYGLTERQKDTTRNVLLSKDLMRAHDKIMLALERLEIRGRTPALYLQLEVDY